MHEDWRSSKTRFREKRVIKMTRDEKKAEKD